MVSHNGAVNYSCYYYHPYFYDCLRTAESCILIRAVRAVGVAVAEEAGVGAVSILTLELADGAETGRAGLRFI